MATTITPKKQARIFYAEWCKICYSKNEDAVWIEMKNSMFNHFLQGIINNASPSNKDFYRRTYRNKLIIYSEKSYYEKVKKANIWKLQ